MVGMQKMMKQAQQMQAKLMKVQDEISRMEVEGSSGGGIVKAVVSGKKDLISISLNPDVVDPEDVQMLEDLILAAVRQAGEKADEAGAEKMSAITGGMNIPGLGM
ncbi:MAG: YbaB/EbfC family nucleoid-associated protein [Candidatus Auribacterota bacterium]|nr:YbaB/EbfC family nucleoid-associated protein [Candidatus Auribacterota bacterium]